MSGTTGTQDEGTVAVEDAGGVTPPASETTPPAESDADPEIEVDDEPAEDEPDTSFEKLQAGVEKLLDADGGKADDKPPAAGGKKEGEDPPDPAEVAPGLPEELLAEAKAAGLTEDQVKRLVTPEAVRTVIDATNEQMTVRGRQPEPPAQPPPPATPPPAAGSDQAGAAPPAGSEAERAAEVLKSLGIDPEQYDESVVGAFGKLGSEIFELKRLHADREAADQVVRQQEVRSKTEVRISALGEPFHDVFGKDPSQVWGLPEDNPLRQNVSKVLEQMDAFANGYRASGRAVPDGDMLFNWSIQTLFADKRSEMVRTEITRKLDQRGSQTIGRPTQKRGKPLTGDAAARKNVKRKLEEFGYGPDADEDENPFE